MVDLEAAIGFVVARGDTVERARLGWLRSQKPPLADVINKAESGQTTEGGWPAYDGAGVASIDATCFHLAELDDLGALERPAAAKALSWIAGRQREDGTWEEDESLADVAPPWARPGDPEARLYLTMNAAFWLAVTAPPRGYGLEPVEWEYGDAVTRAGQVFKDSLQPGGSWPSFLVTGWLGCSVLYHLGWFYESAQVQVTLAERMPTMSAADTAWLAAALRRVGMSPDDWVLQAARKRLAETQRSDGGWESDDGDAFDVHTTLLAIRALR